VEARPAGDQAAIGGPQQAAAQQAAPVHRVEGLAVQVAAAADQAQGEGSSGRSDPDHRFAHQPGFGILKVAKDSQPESTIPGHCLDEMVCFHSAIPDKGDPHTTVAAKSLKPRIKAVND
jgi:hypothetical protein